MEEETVNRIVLAIQTQLSPVATQAQRQEAQQVKIYWDLDQIFASAKKLFILFSFLQV